MSPGSKPSPHPFTLQALAGSKVLFIGRSGSIQEDRYRGSFSPQKSPRPGGHMTEMAIALRGQRAIRVSHLAAALVCLVGLLAPALWNGYPLLQYDTGGYLARWYEGYLVPSRSTDAVGTLVTERPPHRTVRAAFPHTAPTSGV